MISAAWAIHRKKHEGEPPAVESLQALLAASGLLEAAAIDPVTEAPFNFDARDGTIRLGSYTRSAKEGAASYSRSSAWRLIGHPSEFNKPRVTPAARNR